jgi:hypothetical protein
MSRVGQGQSRAFLLEQCLISAEFGTDRNLLELSKRLVWVLPEVVACGVVPLYKLRRRL